MRTWRVNGKSSGETRRIKKKKKIQKTPTILRLRSGATKGNKLRVNSLPKTTKLGGQPLAHGASSSVDKSKRYRSDMGTLPPSIDTHVPFFGSGLLHDQGRKPGDPMKDLDVNLAIWGFYMNTTLKAAVHLGKDCGANLRYVKNHLWNTAGQLFRETAELVSGQTETAGRSVIDFQDLSWMWTSLLHSRAYQYVIAKVYVFSDSVFCLGKMENLLNPGKSKFNGNQKTITSAN